MKYLVLLLILIGFVGTAFEESPDFSIADVTWKEASFPSHDGTKATLIVTDHDMNTYLNAIDHVWVEIHSDSDNVGFRMTLFETNYDSGIFKGDVIFVATSPSGRGFLHTEDGDTITAKYVDKNLPTGYVSESGSVLTKQGLEIFTTALVGQSWPPLERVPASNFRLVDVDQKPITNNLLPVDQQIKLVSDLENQQNYTQPFAYLVQIQNDKNHVVSLSWLAGNLTSFQKITPGVTWIPFKEGLYIATVFVWESVDNPTALSPPLSLEIGVENEN
jgi:hypothetical protein